jgi:hypothetical protein
MITTAQLDALANTLSLISIPSPSLAGVVQISITPDVSTLSLQQVGPGQVVTGLLKFVRFADAGLAEWTATITGTQLTGGSAIYTFSGETGTPQVGQTVTIIACNDATYNVTGVITSLPSSTQFTIAIAHPDLAFVGGQTGRAMATGDIDILPYVATNVLGGQPMPAFRIPLPGPGLQGAQLPPSTVTTNAPITGPGGLTAAITSPTVAANPASPSLGDDSGLTLGQRLQDLLAGVPGIVAHIEQHATAAIMAPVTVSVEWTLVQGKMQTSLPGAGALLNFLPLPSFGRLGTAMGFSQFIIQATVTLTAAGITSDPVTLARTVTVPQIPVPALGAVFTWRSYGTQSSDGDTNPDDDSTLLMIPPDSPIGDHDSIIGFLNNQLVPTLQGLASTFGMVATLGAAAGIATDPAITSVSTVAGNLSGAAAGSVALVNALNFTVTGHADYEPFVISRAAVSVNTGPLGGFDDMYDNDLFRFDKEWPGYDHYHDKIKSAMIVGPLGIGLELDYNHPYKGPSSDDGQLVLQTAGNLNSLGALFVGVRDLSNVAATTDPGGLALASSGHSLYTHTQSMRFLP